MPKSRLEINYAPLLLVIFCLLFSGCNNGSDDGLPEHIVSGIVTYKRLPLKTDDRGYPLGLESSDKAETLPLRGAAVRAVWQDKETMPDGTSVEVWRTGNPTTTTANGSYSLRLVNKDELPVFIEVFSTFFFDFGTGETCTVRVIADEDGMRSSVPQADRVLYSLRKGLDGSAPEGDPVPAVAKSGRALVNFEIDLDEKWWIGHPSAKYAPEAKLEPTGTGSRVAAIMDTAFKAVASFGNPSPGGVLDIHYKRGFTELLGTYVEYDRELFPAAFDPAGIHFFGSVRGGPQYDDAWDEGTLLSMMARNNLRRSSISAHFQLPPKKFPGFDDPKNRQLSEHLQPTMAMLEGLPDAMAAILLKTPYLTAASGTSVRDIREIAKPSDIFSSPAVAAFAWDLALKACGISAPGTPETWKGVGLSSIHPLYSLVYKTSADEGKDIKTYSDLPSIFTQLALTSSAYDGSVLEDGALTQLAGDFFGAVWPRPEEGPLSCFIADWGSDPDSREKPIPTFTFSMADAELDAGKVFPNLTAKENMTAKMALSKDTTFWLTVTPSPGLPSGSSIECRIVECIYNSSAGKMEEGAYRSLVFGPSSDRQRVVLRGRYDGALHHLLHFSIKSPTIKVPNTQITVQLEPAN